MYTIRQAAARTGLSAPLIRAWERRYGVVEPSRTPAGYRLYDDESIARLVAMHNLVAGEGWAPRQAAQRVMEPGADLLALGGHTGTGPPAEAPAEDAAAPDVAAAGRSASLAEAFVSAARELDVPAMERVLDESLASLGFERAFDGVVSPALVAIGAAWKNQTLDVAAEHAASETVRRRLARFFDAGGAGTGTPRLIVGMPPDGHHEIGAFAFAVAARRAGLGVLYLGANVPVDSWVRTVRETGAAVVVLGAVTRTDPAAAGLVAEALRALPNPPLCFVGGPRAGTLPEGPWTARLPATLEQSVAAVASALRVPAEL